MSNTSESIIRELIDQKLIDEEKTDAVRQIILNKISFSTFPVELSTCRFPTVPTTFVGDEFKVMVCGKNIYDFFEECKKFCKVNSKKRIVEYTPAVYLGWVDSNENGIHFYIGYRDGTCISVFYMYMNSFMICTTVDYDSDGNTDKHRKNYRFFPDGYSHMKLSLGNVVDLIRLE